MSRTITAAVAREAGTPFALEAVQLADPGPGEILVEIRGVGICHTDIAARDGVFGLAYPMVLGHEGSGVVVEVGAGVTAVEAGDHVALSFDSCGACGPCRAHDPAYCREFPARNYGGGARPDGTSALTQDGAALTAGFFGQSSLATHALANGRNVVKVDRDLPLELLGPLGCGIQTGAGAVMHSLDGQEGESLLVLGGGPVGLAAVMAAKVRGMTPIIVSEPDPRRRALALELGATDIVDPQDGPLPEQVRAVAPDGVDHAFDTTGSVAVLEAALGALGVHGTLGLVGLPRDFAATLPVSIVGAMVSGLTVRGITEGDADPQTFIPELLALYREGRFPFDRLITTFPFAEIERAIQAQHDGEATKVVLVHGPPASTDTPTAGAPAGS
jgi:aryl-alcohol dehydrogenase